MIEVEVVVVPPDAHVVVVYHPSDWERLVALIEALDWDEFVIEARPSEAIPAGTLYCLPPGATEPMPIGDAYPYTVGDPCDVDEEYVPFGDSMRPTDPELLDPECYDARPDACWRCDALPARAPVGLCAPCTDVLTEEKS